MTDDDTKTESDTINNGSNTDSSGSGSGSGGSNPVAPPVCTTGSTPSTITSTNTGSVNTSSQGNTAPTDLVTQVTSSVIAAITAPEFIAHLVATINKSQRPPAIPTPVIKPDPHAQVHVSIPAIPVITPPLQAFQPPQMPLTHTVNSALTSVMSSALAPTTVPMSVQLPVARQSQWQASSSVYSSQQNITNMHPTEKVQLIHKSVGTYESRQDPMRYIQNIEKLMIHHQVTYQDIIYNIKTFFEDSKDKEVKTWFDSYRDRIEVQLDDSMDPYFIWIYMSEELLSTFGKVVAFEQAREALRIYEYSGETVDEYITKVRALGRKVEPRADERRIVQMLYEHLPGEIRTAMRLGGQYHTIQEFRSRFGDYIKYFIKKKKNSSASSTIASFIAPSSSVRATGPRSPQQQQTRGNCHFCNLGPHKWRECRKMAYVIKKLMDEDTNLTQAMIEDAVIRKVPHKSSALENFFRDPKSYYPPNSRSPQNSTQCGQNYGNRGRGNSGGRGRRQFYRRTNDQRNLEGDEEEIEDEEESQQQTKKKSSSPKKEN